MGSIRFYVHRVGGFGTFYCRIEIVDENGRPVAKCEPVTVEFGGKNRFEGVEFVIEFPVWELPAAHLFKFALFANFKPDPIGITEIRFVEPMSP